MKPREIKIYDAKQSFVLIWGKKTEGFGFAQIPNILIRNLKQFDITHVEFCLLMYIHSRLNDEGDIFTYQIIEDLDISKSNLGIIFRSLSKKKYLHRHYIRGFPNKYSLKGLYTAVDVYAKNRDTSLQKLNTPETNIAHTYSQKLDTNNTKNKEYKHEGNFGSDNDFLKRMQHLKKLKARKDAINKRIGGSNESVSAGEGVDR